jgi:hypothetical protein
MAHWRSTLDPALYPAAGEVEPGGKAVDWSAIWAGTAAAIAITLLLLALGAGFGLASVSPWPGVGAQASTFSIGAGIWLIVMQWVSSSVGGYLAGRMRSRWHGLHSDETFFRDTAQGLITWSVATMIVAGVAVLMTTLAGLAGSDQSQHVGGDGRRSAEGRHDDRVVHRFLDAGRRVHCMRERRDRRTAAGSSPLTPWMGAEGRS